MTNKVQESFITTAAGKFFDPDGVYAFQCVDTAIAYAAAIFPGVSWEKTFGRNNANGHYPKDNGYWESIPNIVGDLDNYPRRGDVVIWGGDGINPYGHIAVVVDADANTMLVLQQNYDGSAALPTQLARMPYVGPGTGGVVGWLRPKVKADVTPAPIPPTVTKTLNGIDVSGHQKGIDVAATGAAFVIIKATEGVGYIDPEFKENLDKARRAGKLVGFYHFCRPGATPENTAKAEADWFVSVIKPHLGPDDVVVCDWEADKVTDVAWTGAFAAAVKAESQKTPWLYMNQNHANNLPWPATVKATYPLWGAAYPSNARQSWGPLNSVPAFPGWNLVAWQYSQTGQLPGFPGTLDLNVFYGTAADWRKLAAGGSYKPAGSLAKPKPPVSKVSQCIVEPGDTLTSIAAQFKVSLADLLKVNPGINPDVIYPGQVLNLPGKGGPSAPAAQPKPVSQCVVEAGDTLAGIAAQFGVDLQALISLNGLPDPDLIYPGQVLNLPAKKAAAPKPPAKKPAPSKPAPKPVRPKQCVVEPGDSMSSIAAQFGVSLSALIAKNPQVPNPDYIQVGQVLNLP